MLKKCVERYFELANKKTEQLYKSQVLAWMITPFQGGGTGNGWRTVTSMLANFLEMFILVGCARNKCQYPTVLQNEKSFVWMQD